MKRTAVVMTVVVAALVGVVPGPASATVIGTDDRTTVADTTVAPFGAIGQLESTLDGEDVVCSAFLVDANTVVTAGHCLHTGGHAAHPVFATSATFTPGRAGPTQPFGDCDVENLFVANLWISSSSANDDWAVAQLDCNVGNTTGWLRMKFLSDAQLLHRAIRVTGNANDDTMQTANDQVRKVAAKLITHRADTDAGQSGAPIYAPTGCSGPCVLGIQTAGCPGACASPNGNRGVRITLGLIEVLTEIASTNDPRPDALIRVGNGPFVGNDEINGSGVGQVRDAHVNRGGTANFTARIQSDGSGPVDLHVRGPAGSGPFTVKYFAGPTNITAQVRNGTYALDDLAVGTSADIRIQIKVAGNAAHGARGSFTLTATSQTAPNYRDLVRANVFVN